MADLTVEQAEQDIGALLNRIDALQGLLACYRIGKHPTETLMKRLDRSAPVERDVRERACARQGAPDEF